MRLLNFCLVILLVLATAYVYEIKFEATLRVTKVAEMRNEVRRERDAIAALRAEYARLESPGRLESLARRFLNLQPAELWQFDPFDRLPERPREIVVPTSREPLVSRSESDDPEIPTASVRAAPGAR